MADQRFTFPDDRTAFVYQGPGQPILTPPRTGLQLYADQGATILADVQTLAGLPIAAATVYTGADGLVPLFLGPLNVLQVWAKVLGTAMSYPMNASLAQQIANLPMLVSGHGSPPTALGVANSFYIDVDAKTLWGPKATAGWPAPPTLLVGPQGPSGGAQGGYVYAQTTPALTWTILHPLSFQPNVTVLDATGAKALADVSYPAPGQVLVSFAAPQTGSAVLS